MSVSGILYEIRAIFVEDTDTSINGEETNTTRSIVKRKKTAF